MVAFGYSVLELFRNLWLDFKLATNELSHIIDDFKGYIERVNCIRSIKKIQSALLLDPTQNKLFFICVTIKELLPQEGKIHLAGLVHVIKHRSDETAGCDSVIYLKDFNQRKVFLVVLVDGELVGSGQDHCVTLGVPPDFLG